MIFKASHLDIIEKGIPHG